MRKFFSITGICAAVAGGALGQISVPVHEGRYWVQTFRGEAPAAAAARMRIGTEGNLVLRGQSSDKIVYALKARVKARNAQEAAALLRAFEIRGKGQGDWFNLTVTIPRENPAGPDLSVQVPRRLRQVWVESRGGGIDAGDMEGELRAESAGGRISVDRIGLNATVKTGGGDIQVGRVGGAVRCYSGGGSIRVDSSGGESWLETAGGEIAVRESLGAVHASTAGGNIRVDRAIGTVYAKTAGGVIDVRQASGTVTAESSGGAIQVNAARGVRCESANGTIRLRNVGGALRATAAAGSILAELLAGNRIEDSMLSTNAGDVTVFIAAGIGLTVLARNESAGSVGRIVSEFPEIRVRTAGPGAAPALAEGRLNGGGPVLRISVNGGSIYLKRENDHQK
jgi:hypothetical protein